MSEPLTPRELQVLDLSSRGLSQRLIAAEMGIKVSTVKTHQRRVVAKLGAIDARHAIRLGFEAKLLVGDAR